MKRKRMLKNADSVAQPSEIIMSTIAAKDNARMRLGDVVPNS